MVNSVAEQMTKSQVRGRLRLGYKRYLAVASTSSRALNLGQFSSVGRRGWGGYV